MQHIYENNTSNHVTVNIIKNGVVLEVFVFPPFSNREFDFPALDLYVPTLLTKKCPITGARLVPKVKEEKVEVKTEVVIEEKLPEIVEYAEENTKSTTEEPVVVHVEDTENISVEDQEEPVVVYVEDTEENIKVAEEKPKKSKKTRK